MVKIAFLFLLVGNPHKKEEWKKFFNNTDNSKYSIYCHCSKPKYLTDLFFKKNLISKKIQTKWGDISLVKAMMLLLEEAFKDNKITHFQFISDSCVPLFPFHFIFNEMTRLDKSFIEYVIDNKRLDNPYSKLFKKSIPYYRQSQWMTLTRDHVEFFLSNDKTELFKDCEIPDESYFINTLLTFKPKESENIIGQSLTYVNWKCDLPRPMVFKEIDDKHILDSFPKGYLFLRKIDKECLTTFMFPKVNLLTYLSQYKNEKCILAPIGGWAGDAFITISAHQVLKNTGIQYEIFNSDKSKDYYINSLLLVCGSGNLVKCYNSVSQSLLRWSKIPFKKIIILPSTINYHYDVLNSLPNNTDIICRERISYQLVKHNVKNKNIILSDDLAFFFNIDKWKNKKPNKNILVSIRNDDEKINIPKEILPPNYKNYDLAEDFLGKCKNYIETEKACHRFLNKISEYKIIYTNRLHTAIAASRMKRKVFLLPNSYYKNIGIYQNSLYMYDNVFMFYPFKLLDYKPYIENKINIIETNIFDKNK